MASKKSYTVSFKLKVIERAEKEGKKGTAKYSGIDRRRVQECSCDQVTAILLLLPIVCGGQLLMVTETEAESPIVPVIPYAMLCYAMLCSLTIFELGLLGHIGRKIY